MIESSVQVLLDNFTRKYSFGGEEQPLLNLDYNWPSIAVVEALLFPLRLRTELTEEENERIRGAAAYIASVALTCWKSFNVEAQLVPGEQGVKLIAVSGYKLSDGNPFTVYIEEVLRKILKTPPNPFPVIESFEREISIDYKYISLFAYGVCYGLTPFGEGPWQNETLASFATPVEAVTKEIARQWASYYARVFPSEPLGQVAELYLNQLIYPPVLLQEGFPAVTGVKGFFNFLNDFQIPNDQGFALAQNLALTNDEIVSQVGVAVDRKSVV